MVYWNIVVETIKSVIKNQIIIFDSDNLECIL